MLAVALIAALPVVADAAPRNQRDLDAIRVAAVRELFGLAQRLPRGEKGARAPTAGSLFCFDTGGGPDSTPRVLAKLKDLPYVLKPLSECMRNRQVLESEDGNGPYNKMVIHAITWTSKDAVEVDTQAFGAHCVVGLTRTRAGWSARPRGRVGCVS